MSPHEHLNDVMNIIYSYIGQSNENIVAIDIPGWNCNPVRNINAQQMISKNPMVNETHGEKISIEIFNWQTVFVNNLWT